MKTFLNVLIFASLSLISTSCMNMQGRAPAAQLKQQLTLKVDSVTMGNNKAMINGSITASNPSAYSELTAGGPSMVVTEQYDGQIEAMLPMHLVNSRGNNTSQEQRKSLDAGETETFSIILQLTEEFPGKRNRIPGMLYLSSDNGTSGHLVEPNCALLMKVAHSLSDSKGQPFSLTAKEDLLVVVIDGQLRVKIME